MKRIDRSLIRPLDERYGQLQNRRKPSLRPLTDQCVRANRFYVNRAVGCYCGHWNTRVSFASSAFKSKSQGTECGMRQQLTADKPRMHHPGRRYELILVSRRTGGTRFSCATRHFEEWDRDLPYNTGWTRSSDSIWDKMGSVSSPWWQGFYKPYSLQLHHKEVSSYGLNSWFSVPERQHITYPIDHRVFLSDEEIEVPQMTPLIGDSAGPNPAPTSDQLPGRNLNEPAQRVTYEMKEFAIPRHGARPRVVPTDHPPEEKLPGAINMAFFDGHVEQVQLERLWSLYWHKNYVAPPKRPGLQ